MIGMVYSKFLSPARVGHNTRHCIKQWSGYDRVFVHGKRLFKITPVTTATSRQYAKVLIFCFKVQLLCLTSFVCCSFGFVGSIKRCPGFCEFQAVGPNGGSAADGVASIFAHEISEIISDPDATAWSVLPSLQFLPFVLLSHATRLPCSDNVGGVDSLRHHDSEMET